MANDLVNAAGGGVVDLNALQSCTHLLKQLGHRMHLHTIPAPSYNILREEPFLVSFAANSLPILRMRKKEVD